MPVARIGNDKAAFSAACYEPIRRSNRTPISPAGDADARVVLLRAVNVVRKRVINCDMVELRGRLVILRRPRFAAVGRNVYAAVIRVPDSSWILRINPEPMVISMPRGQQIERFSAIDRAK